MDFPLNLQENKFVSGIDEFKQSLTIIFKNEQGSFFQSGRLGSLVALHASDEDLVKLYVEETISQMRGVTIKALQIKLPNISMTLEYQGDLINYEFSI